MLLVFSSLISLPFLKRHEALTTSRGNNLNLENTTRHTMKLKFVWVLMYSMEVCYPNVPALTPEFLVRAQSKSLNHMVRFEKLQLS